MTKFSQKTYNLLKKVPRGKVTTYKALAKAQRTKAYQAIGTLMKNNPHAPVVPCHRVVKSDGTLGGFRGSKNTKTVSIKKQMLIDEGIEFKGNRVKDFKRSLHSFN